MNKKFFYLCFCISLCLPWHCLASDYFACCLPSSRGPELSYAEIERPLALPNVNLYCIAHKKEKSRGFIPTISGFVQHEAYWDTRQVVGQPSQGDLLLYPEFPRFDICCRQINKKGSFNMLNIQSRIRAEALGPVLCGADTYAVFECDCRGSDVIALVDIFRSKHAFLFFSWEKSSLLIGQYYHPIILPDYQCVPSTISYNSGMPIEPYTLAPQIRYTSSGDSFSFTAAAMAHAYRLEVGPQLEDDEPRINNLYGRRAIMPNLYAGMYTTIHGHHLGCGADVFRLVPRIVTNENIRHTESIWSCLLHAFAVYNDERFQLKMRAIYAQNGVSYTLLSGYAVHSIDPATDIRTYANLQSLSLWTDIAITGACEPGIFMGITKNIGASKSIHTDLVYAAEREKIDYVARISPRLRCYIQPLILGFEFEFTRAAFGTLDYRGRVKNAIPVNNIRFLSAAYYCF